MTTHKKVEKKYSKLEAIEYLVEHNVYGNEWQGAGMWEIVCEMMMTKKAITEKYLNSLLKKAEDR